VTNVLREPKQPEGGRQHHEVTQVGARLREMRQARKLTLTKLAELSGVPASTISKIENGQLRPSLVNAISLASALQENLGFLVDRYRAKRQPRVVVRAGERDTIEFRDMRLTLQDMNGSFEPGVLESRVGVLSPRARSGAEAMQHVGEEFCCVLEGAIRYRIGEQVIELGAGEYIHFRSTLKHSWQNAHKGETRVLWVFSDGLSF
jgi:transcriptional regulator with XRE-family HTH domain